MAGQRWTEAALSALGPDEYDFQEYKGSALVSQKGTINGELMTALSKQLSAFANGAGGRILLGLDDQGQIDGGVPTSLKQGGTRSWLEDLIPGLVDPPLASFNVHEVLGGAPDSAIQPGHAVYVLEVPSSELAPHQALDHRYYLRIAGKSRPMGHLHLQDVLRRTRNPDVHLLRLTPYGPAERLTNDPRGPKVMVALKAQIANRGRTLAHHVGLELVMPRPVVNREVRRRTLEDSNVQLTQRPGTVSFFRYHPQPVFPGQELTFLTTWIAVHAGNLAAIRSGDAEILARVYADDAPVREFRRPIGSIGVLREESQWVERAGRR